jgi:hypothetical protein
MRPVCKKEEVMRPIPGQPGLFRLDDFSVPPPATGYTWDVPRGRPWVLGEIPQSLRDQARANSQNLAALKTSADPLVRAVPWSTEAYAGFVRRVVTSPQGAILRVTREDLGLLVRGVISNVGQSQILAEGLLANPRATEAQISRARRLLFSAKDVMVKLERMLNAARPLTSRLSAATGAAAGAATGIGDLSIPVILLAAAVVLVAAFVVYQLVASLQLNVTAIAEANEACRLDAEAGNPCSGTDYQEYLRRALEEQRRNGFVPNLDDLFKQGGSLLFWGGLLVLGAGLAYAAWTAEPARRSFAQRFASEPLRGAGPVGRQRSTKRRSRA